MLFGRVFGVDFRMGEREEGGGGFEQVEGEVIVLNTNEVCFA